MGIMLQSIWRASLGLVLILGFSARAVWAVELPGALVETEWLAAHQDEVVVVDVRADPASFTATGHIPKAVVLDYGKLRVEREMNGEKLEKVVSSAEEFEKTAQLLGLNNDSVVVLTTQGENMPDVTMGTRVYWTFKYFGHDQVALLNGGNAKWVAENRLISKAPSEIRAGEFKVTETRDAILATTVEVAEALEQGTQLVDSRSLDFYLGLAMKPYVYGKGHLPGAKYLPQNVFIHYEAPATFFDMEALKETLASLGISPDRPTIAYCNSGHLASGAWFVLSELMDNKAVKLYDGSMHAWTKDQNRPLVTMKMN